MSLTYDFKPLFYVLGKQFQLSAALGDVVGTTNSSVPYLDIGNLRKLICAPQCVVQCEAQCTLLDLPISAAAPALT